MSELNSHFNERKQALIDHSDSPFLLNAWYVAGWSKDLDRRPTPMVLLGQKIVMFRKQDGSPVALEDACAHRKAPLSRGTVKGDEIECGYHGLQYNADGVCTRAPTQGHVPKSAKVRSYPAADKWGLLWIWMGDPDLASTDDIFEIPNYDNPDWALSQGGSMDVACNYLYITDNLLDPSHVAWVHQSSFAGERTDDLPVKTEVEDDRVVVSRWIFDCPPPPYYAPRVRFSGNCDRLQHYEVRLPSLAINKSIFTPAGAGGGDKPLHDSAYVMVSYNFITPVDENSCRYFWFQHRNTDPSDATVTKEMHEGAVAAFKEDKDILEAVHAGMAARASRCLDLAGDAGPLRFRRLLDSRVQDERRLHQCANTDAEGM